MAEYELLFFVMRRIDAKAKPWMVICGAFALSAVIGYFPSVGDWLCLSRMVNFLPIYAIGYYMDMTKANEFFEKKWLKIAGAGIIIASICVAKFGKWSLYSWRKWFTGRRSYEFLSGYFKHSNVMVNGWWIRLAVWAVAIAITFALLALIPDKDMGFITTIGARTLQVYFWHRPLCYLFRSPMGLFPKLVSICGGYEVALIIYIIIGAAVTAFFSLKIFEHPTKELLELGSRLTKKGAGAPK